MYLALTAWSVFESVLCTAVIFGWAQLVEILENEQYFLSYCEHEAKSNVTILPVNTNKSFEHVNTHTCTKQDGVLRMAYTTSVFACFASIFLSGKYLDMFGFRKTRLLASFIYLLAGLAMFVSTYGIHEMLFPGLLLTVIGGGSFISILVKVCGILPHRRYTAISVVNGAIDSSAVMFLLFKLCYNAGISFRTVVIVYYSFVFGQGMLFTFTIFPKDLPKTKETIENSESDKNYSGSSISANNGSEADSESQLKNENVSTETSEKMKENDLDYISIQENDEKISLLFIIKSPKFIFHTCFVSISSLRSFAFVGMINTTLKRLTNDEKKVDFYLTILGLIQFCGIVLAFIPGFLLDWSPAGKHRSFSIILSFILTATMSILLTIGLLIPVLELQIFNFFLYTIMRSFLYSTHGSFIIKDFPLYHAGALFGLSLLVSAVASLFQMLMFSLMEGPYNGDPTWVNVGLLVTQILVLVHPVYLWKCSKYEKKCDDHNIQELKTEAKIKNKNTSSKL